MKIQVEDHGRKFGDSKGDKNQVENHRSKIGGLKVEENAQKEAKSSKLED